MQVSMKFGGFILLLTFAGLISADTVSAQTLQDLRHELQVAVCRRDWNQAIQLTGSLIASSDISSKSRESLVDFRHSLENIRNQQLAISTIPGCDETLSRYLTAVPEESSYVNWQSAIARLSGNATRPPEQVVRQVEGFMIAGLGRQVETEIPALTPAIPVETSTGAGVSASEVSQDYQIFRFVGGQGDQVTIDVDVTQVLPGILYSDDDSQLFLFDSTGTLLANNDDLSQLQSRISNFVLPQSGIYYVAVTTYNNDPILDADRRITGWSGNGGSFIEFTLSIAGVTPPNQLVIQQSGSQQAETSRQAETNQPAETSQQSN
ncbi:MAG TPA: DVUA0089 family protein [Trichocoleus sp.]